MASGCSWGVAEFGVASESAQWMQKMRTFLATEGDVQKATFISLISVFNWMHSLCPIRRYTATHTDGCIIVQGDHCAGWSSCRVYITRSSRNSTERALRSGSFGACCRQSNVCNRTHTAWYEMGLPSREYFKLQLQSFLGLPSLVHFVKLT